MSERPVTMSFRERSRNPGHVEVQVFVGRNPGARGNSGTLTLRTDEWDELNTEHHHIEFRDDGWTILHTLIERLDGSLLDCPLSNWTGGDPGVRGRYVLQDARTLGEQVSS